MAGIYPLIPGFFNGVLSRKMWGKVTSEIWSTALEYCTNWVIAAQGSIRKRPGSQWISEFTTQGCSLYTFNRAEKKDYVIAFVDGKVHFIDKDGDVPDTVNLVYNGDFLEGASGWNMFSTVPNPNPPCIINGVNDFSGPFTFKIAPLFGGGSPLSPPSARHQYTYNNRFSQWGRMSQVITTVAAGTLHKLIYSYSMKNFVFQRVYPLNKVILSIKIGTAAGLGDLYTRSIIMDANAVAQGVSQTITENNFEASFTPPGVTFYLSVESVMQLSYTPDQVEITGDIYLDDIKILANFAAPDVDIVNPYSASEAADLHTVMDSVNGILFFLHKNHPPKELLFDTTVSPQKWVLRNVTFVSPPSVWVTGNYPRTGEIHQSRLYLAATPNQPAGVWGSKVGNYRDFTVGSNPADGLAFTIASPMTIRWLKSNKLLLIGCDNAIWKLDSNTGVITPADFQFASQAFYGSSKIMPVLTGNVLCFVSHDYSKVRAARDGGDSIYGYTVDDITLKVKGLTQYDVVDLEYCLNPDYQLYALLADGTIARATYDNSLQILAWTKHETDGQIISMTSTNDGDGTFLFMAVSRRQGVIDIELTNSEEIFELQVDSWMQMPVKWDGVYTGGFSNGFNADEFDFTWSTGGRYIDGLNRFEGKIVSGACFTQEYSDMQQLAMPGAPDIAPYRTKLRPEGFSTPTEESTQFLRPLGEYLVVDGKIHVEFWVGEFAYVGQPFEAKFKTLPLEGGNAAGVSQGSKNRMPRIFARLVNSALPVINGYRLKINEDSQIPQWGVAEDARVSDDIFVSSEGFARKSAIEVEAPSPLRTEISGLFGKAESNTV